MRVRGPGGCGFARARGGAGAPGRRPAPGAPRARARGAQSLVSRRAAVIVLLLGSAAPAAPTATGGADARRLRVTSLARRSLLARLDTIKFIRPA